MSEFQQLHEMQLTLRRGRIDTGILYTPGPCCGTMYAQDCDKIWDSKHAGDKFIVKRSKITNRTRNT